MPFTFAHPAAAVPLTRRGLVLSALVVGSMSPDLLYLVHLAPRGTFGHTLPGLFLFCLPAGLAVLWAFHRLMKPPLLRLFPVPLQERLAPHAGAFAFGPAGRLARVAASVLIGAVTHQLWDAFTHQGSWGVEVVPGLSERVTVPVLGRVYAFRIVQHGSTLLGFALLAAWTTRWYRRAPRRPTEPLLRSGVRAGVLAALVVGAVAFGAAYGLVQAAPQTGMLRVHRFVGHAVVATLAAGLVELVALGIGWRLLTAAQR
ncbi:MAG: DUF4184 family protein [Rhodothermales bacterium]|nr:DUF4184 family protein [Rhodothermales bacterium]